MATEAAYQSKLVKRIEERFPGCFVMRTNPMQIQGLPDLLILFDRGWAMLEVKRSPNEPFQPNQEYYLQLFGEMSYAVCIFPENEEQIFHDLQFAFGS